MGELFEFINRNGLWVMIIAVVAITQWFNYRKREMKSYEDMRLKEMEHQQKLKELELELEKVKAKNSATPAS